MFSGIRKKIIIIVVLTSIGFLSAGVFLGAHSAKKMSEMVAAQFNEEQLIIARNISGLIERELSILRKEICLLGKQISAKPFVPDEHYDSIHNSFARVLESGVWKIEIVDSEREKTYIYMPYKAFFLKEVVEVEPDELSQIRKLALENVWISKPHVKPSGMSIMLAIPLLPGSTKVLVFDVNISWFLRPFLKDIRSGKTGYAWLIDGRGIFIFHPKADFVGKVAFEARQEEYPGVPYEKINFIQKEQMLKGQEGTSWYFSGWHRGITGKIKKLIAYSPVSISDNPPRKWSVAVVAPVSEIEGAVHQGQQRQLLLQGLVIIVILVGAVAVLIFEIRWSGSLEKEVTRRTEELRKSEEKYRSLVESAEDFIFTVDSKGRFQSMNSFTANFFGGSPLEFLGKDLSSLFPEEVAKRQLKLVGVVYEFGKSIRDEFEMEMGGHDFWISANFMPLKDEDGNVSAVLCIARDDTENKNLERQLINAEKLASMGTLAAGVAHEVNNPLGVILGFCDLLLLKTDKDTQQYEDLKTIERQGLHCKQVVENLLSFARVGEGHSEYSDLNLCLKEIIKVVKHTLEMNDIELITEFDRNIPPVKGDYRQLQQVFLNLINNAIAAMENGGNLSIHTSMDRGNRKAVIQFKDNGHGIGPEDMEHIFEPFFTTKPEGEGTGLGLFVSYGIINKYGGIIECVSNTSSSLKPRGTSFIIKLLTEN